MKIAIVDPSTARVPMTWDRVRDQIASTPARLEPLRWKLVRVPFGLGHPSWAAVGEIDVDYHVRRAALPSPGGQEELDELVSSIASSSLERDRPLWQIWFVEGLEHGYVAYVAKVHHALADGASSAQMIVDAFQESPEAGADDQPSLPIADVVPSDGRLLVDGLRDVVRVTRGLPSLISRTARSARASLERRRRGMARQAQAYASPATRFNRTLTPNRWYANVTVSLDDMKTVKAAFGCSLNDVFVAMIGRAVRGYLEAHGELPDQPLTAAIPVSIRSPDEQRTWGNRLTTWYVDLATDVADPVDRLRRVTASTGAARESQEAKDQELMGDWLECWWLFDGFMRVTRALFGRLLHRPVYNIIGSNVRGPDQPLYADGARLVAIQSMGPLSEELGLNITGWSYCGQMSIGVVACRERVPDVRRIADGLTDAAGELLTAAKAVQDEAVAR